MSPRTAIRHQFTETQRDTRGRLVRFAATASGVLIIDQLTKTTARLLLPLDQEGSPHDPVGSQSLGFLRSANAGSALGFGQHQQRWVILALLGSLLTLFFALHRPSSLAMIAAGLLIGGALSNVADRVLDGGATDFLLVGDLILNLADVALLVGTGIAITLAWLTPAASTTTWEGGEVR